MKTRLIKLTQVKVVAAFFIIVLCATFVSCGDSNKEKPVVIDQPKAKLVPEIAHTLVNTFPHDTTAFTEGLLFYNNNLFESTANNLSTCGGTASPAYMPHTKSAIGIVNLEKGKLDIKVEIDKALYFGEGMVILNNKIYQLTYMNQLGFIYDAKTYKKIGQFNYKNKEGWGLTTDGKHIIMSDGTYNLTYLNPDDLSVVKTIAVTESGYGLDHINELEFIKGFIYANVWMTNYIVKIDPVSGEVVGKIELDELNVTAKAKYPRSLEMNGIAYDSISDRILVTGKLWPNIYEIKFAH
ncbi:glutaminyl-peptide cyclotransferase [Aurantibacillus circumpalustris]|uniref:glutaminyl-peptide cyclotransferase n=1 Tax=Aurantibacillus circumpalustris TaxID=3036359 RepID=UPI00295A5F26|nr:glutaminyl-peptide cyclotransferase [Aurantibacillus circumpalustris]